MSDKGITRRAVIRYSLLGVAGLGLLRSLQYLLTGRAQADTTVWQLDPDKCIQCGNCQTKCVLQSSAVKCVHAFAMCGYCDLCTGFLDARYTQRNSAAENQLCPTGAIKRTFINDPYYEYTVDESLCIGCGKCVKGCQAFGNGSLFLQVRHDRCLNCNQCAIATDCPAQAFSRVPTTKPYLLKTVKGGTP